MRRALKIMALAAAGMAACAVMAYALLPARADVAGDDMTWGVTFSEAYSWQLDIDSGQAYLAVLDELGPDVVRLPAYWDMIEPEDGRFDFSRLDWQIREARQRGVDVVVVVGRKQPRWPECYVPAWASELSQSEQDERLLVMVAQAVSHYRQHDNVIAWQVENEPFVDFGVCPEMSAGLLEQEIMAVRLLDQRPVVVTDSGELSAWLRASRYADILGVTTYRRVFDPRIGYFDHFFRPQEYQKRAWLIRNRVDAVWAVEIQAEPWAPRYIRALGSGDALVAEERERIRENVEFAQEMGFAHAYLWGSEWWYWLREHGQDGIWNDMRDFFAT